MKNKLFLIGLASGALFLAGCTLGINKDALEPLAPLAPIDAPVPALEESLLLEGEAKEIVPELTALFVAKNPEYKDTLKVRVDQQTETHARGGVIFVEGMPGGYFLAAKVDGAWNIVLEGNGQIPCTLSEQGFPPEMISDCS